MCNGIKEEKYVLAMYDIRAKQEFIFKCNRIKEIAGASKLMDKCFDIYLYPVAETDGKGIFHDENVAFTEKGFLQHMEEGYIGEVVYEGGGNYLLLFKNEETFKKITYQFTKKVMEEIGTLKILGTCIPIENFEDYKRDRDALYEKHRINEHRESNSTPWGTLPLVKIDRRTYLPIVEKHTTYGDLSKESKLKYEVYDDKDKKYYTEEERTSLRESVKYIDHLVTKKGEDSLLAVVYIDGNNMGAKVEECMGEKKHYDDCIKALREFSDNIQQQYITETVKAIDTKLAENNPQRNKNRRLIIGAGDEINFICNAHDALDCARAYIDALSKHKGASSCVGIAIFHSHAPYSEVYRIAEECCESGKKKMRELGIKNASFVDFHYCQGAIGVSLDEIREAEDNSELSRPWLINAEEDGLSCITFADVDKMEKVLNQIERSNVKALVEAYKKSDLSYRLEVERIYAHMGEKLLEKDGFINYMIENKKLVYDMGIVYDVWFKKGK